MLQDNSVVEVQVSELRYPLPDEVVPTPNDGR